jgi:hypothetical protein
MFRLALGTTQPAIQRAVGFFAEVKWPRHEVDYSPTSGAEVKNGWGYTSTFTVYAIMVWKGKPYLYLCLIMLASCPHSAA